MDILAFFFCYYYFYFFRTELFYQFMWDIHIHPDSENLVEYLERNTLSFKEESIRFPKAVVLKLSGRYVSLEDGTKNLTIPSGFQYFKDETKAQILIGKENKFIYFFGVIYTKQKEK